MKIAIPKENPDLIRAIRGKMIRQIALCAIWTAAVAAFMLLYAYDYFEKSVSIGAAITVWVVLTAIPFIRCKCWRWFTDRSFEGTVISCKQTTSVTKKSLDNSVSPSGAGFIRTYTQNIQILLSNGKDKTFKITWKADADVPYYYEGDSIRYYRGTKYPLVLSDDPNAPKLCVLCGTANLPDDQTCSICRHSLIDRRLTQKEGQS